MDIVQSIHPQWVKKIFSGEKTDELRKTVPTPRNFPYIVYIYETLTDGGAGTVVGEYTCFHTGWVKTSDYKRISETACVPVDNIYKYAGLNKPRMLYCWEISYPVKYDTPRPLSDFGLKRAPQSWCYVSLQGQ